MRRRGSRAHHVQFEAGSEVGWLGALERLESDVAGAVGEAFEVSRQVGRKCVAHMLGLASVGDSKRSTIERLRERLQRVGIPPAVARRGSLGGMPACLHSIRSHR